MVGHSAIVSTLASKMETYIPPKGIACLSVSVSQTKLHDAISLRNTDVFPVVAMIELICNH